MPAFNQIGWRLTMSLSENLTHLLAKNMAMDKNLNLIANGKQLLHNEVIMDMCSLKPVGHLIEKGEKVGHGNLYNYLQDKEIVC